MDKKQLEEKVIGYFAITFQREAKDLVPGTLIKEELGGTSMRMVALISLVENELDIMIPLPEAGKFKTIGDVIDRLAAELRVV
jgi:acyl carrier protein